MPQFYYNTDTVSRIPFQVNEIMRRLILYLSTEILYKQENYQTEEQARQKFIATSVNADMGGREAIAKFGNSNWKFPFTAYSPGMTEPDDTKANQLAESGNYYSEAVGDYVSARAHKFETLFLSFFNSQQDYFTAIKGLYQPIHNLVRLEVPFYIKGVLASFPIDLNVEITKGEYAQEFAEWLAKGKILDLVHNVTVNYFEYEANFFLNREIYPVDDMYLILKSYTSNKDINTIIYNSIIPKRLEVISTYPTDEQINVPVENSVIITFNTSTIEESITRAFQIIPYVEGEFIFDSSGVVVVFNPYENLTSGTIYSCTLFGDTAKDIYSGFLTFDYSFNFTTI